MAGNLVHNLVLTMVNIAEAKTHLSRYLKLAQSGERNVPVAELSANVTEPEAPRRRIGLLEGQMWFSEDAFAPMSEEELEDWYGPVMSGDQETFPSRCAPRA